MQLNYLINAVNNLLNKCSYKFTVLYYTMHAEKMASFVIGVNDGT
jgi:hypothetical protein